MKMRSRLRSKRHTGVDNWPPNRAADTYICTTVYTASAGDLSPAQQDKASLQAWMGVHASHVCEMKDCKDTKEDDKCVTKYFISYNKI